MVGHGGGGAREFGQDVDAAMRPERERAAGLRRDGECIAAAATLDQGVTSRLEMYGAVQGHRGGGRQPAVLIDGEPDHPDVAARRADHTGRLVGGRRHLIHGAGVVAVDLHDQAAQIRVGAREQVHILTAGEHDLAVRRAQGAGILNRGCCQQQPTARRRYLSTILDHHGGGGWIASRERIAIGTHIAGQGSLAAERARKDLRCKQPRTEHVVRDAQGRGDQTRCIDLGRCPEYEAVGIDEINLPIRTHLAENRARVCLENPIERNRRRTRLFEDHLAIRADVEGRPVENRLVVQLVDRQRVAALDRSDLGCGGTAERGREKCRGAAACPCDAGYG